MRQASHSVSCTPLVLVNAQPEHAIMLAFVLVFVLAPVLVLALVLVFVFLRLLRACACACIHGSGIYSKLSCTLSHIGPYLFILLLVLFHAHICCGWPDLHHSYHADIAPCSIVLNLPLSKSSSKKRCCFCSFAGSNHENGV
jgi:hypothetical protein